MDHSTEQRASLIAAGDSEGLVKASQGASLLLEDLLALTRTENPLLAEITFELVAQVSSVEKKLRRLAALGTGQ